MPNDIKITILENGTAKIETKDFSGAAHAAAEKALLWIAQELGGTVTRQGTKHTHTHNHAHNHDHDHAHN